MYKYIDLSMIRGDTLSFDIVLTDYDVSTIQSIYLTVKAKPTDTTAVFQKSLGHGITIVDTNTYRVRVAPSDTHGVEAGEYYYDLQLGFGDDIYTVLLGKMQIIQDVTDN